MTREASALNEIALAFYAFPNVSATMYMQCFIMNSLTSGSGNFGGGAISNIQTAYSQGSGNVTIRGAASGLTSFVALFVLALTVAVQILTVNWELLL